MSDDMARERANGMSGGKARERARRRDQSQTDGRIGEGRNVGVRTVPGGVKRTAENRRYQTTVDAHNPDVRMGAKGSMQFDIGEAICLQPGNDCDEGYSSRNENAPSS